METTRTVELLTTARWSCKGSIVKKDLCRSFLGRSCNEFVQKTDKKAHKNHQHTQRSSKICQFMAPCALGTHRLCRNATAAAARNLRFSVEGWTCHDLPFFSCDCFELFRICRGSSLAITAQFSSKKW